MMGEQDGQAVSTTICASPSTRAAEPDRDRNCFDLLRLLLALLVVYSHACVLGGFGPEGFAALVRNQADAGRIAVIGFFGISGYLVAGSFARRSDPLAFLRARVLRILPGFYLALLVSAFVLAPAISWFNTSSTGWQPDQAWQFVWRNAGVQIGQWHVGDVVNGLPYAQSLNGALWSLFPECCCYVLVLLLGLCGALHGGRVNTAIIAVLACVLHAALQLAPERDALAPTLLALTGLSGYVAAFLVGTALHCFRKELAPAPGEAVLWCLLALLLLRLGGWTLLEPVVLPMALIHTALSVRVRLRADLSYGIYIFHFPVLQLLSAMQLNSSGFVVYLAAGLALTGMLAAISWYAVEKPALRWKVGRGS